MRCEDSEPEEIVNKRQDIDTLAVASAKAKSDHKFGKSEPERKIPDKHELQGEKNSNIASHLKSCHKCQLRRRDNRPPPTLLSPLPLPTEPGQRVHADLFGPLKTSDKGKKFILCVTDAFTKYLELVALPNKDEILENTKNTIFNYLYTYNYLDITK